MVNYESSDRKNDHYLTESHVRSNMETLNDSILKLFGRWLCLLMKQSISLILKRFPLESGKRYLLRSTQRRQLTLKFSAADQSSFSAFDDSAVYPVPGGWGRQGWTIVELEKIKKDLFVDALTTSYCQVAPN